MKLFNKAGEKFSDFFGVSDDLYDEDVFVDEEVVEEVIKEKPIVNTQPKEKTRERVREKTKRNEVKESTLKNNYENKASSVISPEVKDVNLDLDDDLYTSEKIVEMNTYQPTSTSIYNRQLTVPRKQRKVTVYEPRNYIDCKQIAQSLFRKEIIIMSFKFMEERTARRVVDFMTGTVYALDGDIQRLGDELFICTPANVEVDSSMTKSIISTHLHGY